MEAYRLRKDQVRVESVVICVTTGYEYFKYRYVLLEDLNDLKWNEYVIATANHCSCYGFNDTEWNAIKYTDEELRDLIKKKLMYQTEWDEGEFKFFELLKDYFNVVM